jgi:glycerophosphoryl diester phosphodiesterase
MPATGNPGDPGRRGPAISAHRGGSEIAPAGTTEAYRSSLAAGADYAEFDVRRLADGTLVAVHAARLRTPGWRSPARTTGAGALNGTALNGAGPGSGEAQRRLTGSSRPVAGLSYPELCELAGYRVPRTAEVLGLIAAAGARAHVDLKDPAATDQVVAQALSVLDPAAVIVTTRDQYVLRYLRRQFPDVAAGRTIGGDVAELARYTARRAAGRLRTRLDDVTAAGATWAVLHVKAASSGTLAQCRERGLATMVWTVNADDDLRRLLASPLVDVVVTDRPAAAAGLRAEL